MPEALAKFDFQLPLQRVWKDEESGRLLFEGVASNTNRDKQGERMSDRAIAKMATAPPVLIYPDHKRVAGTEYGKTISHEVRNGELYVRGELFPYVPAAVQVYKLASEGWGYEFSVGGDILGAFNEFDKTTNSRVRVLDDLALNHMVVASAGKAACPGTWMEVVAKTLDDVDLQDHETEGEATMPDQATKCQVTDRIRGLVHKAQTVLDDAFGKAGAKHTAAERKTIHGLIQSMHGLCDCDDCKALIAELEGAADEAGTEAGKSTSFSENLKSREARSEGWYVADSLLWDLSSLLSDTVAEIAGSAEVTDKVGAIELALGEFQAAVLARISTATKTNDNDEEGKTMSTTAEQIEAKKAELAALEAQLAAEAGEGAEGAGAEGAEGDAAAAGAEGAEGAAEGDAEGAAGEADKTNDQQAEANKTIAELTAQVTKLTETVQQLAKMPTAGGPVSTAAGEEANKTAEGEDGKAPEDPFAKTVETAAAGLGTADGKAAQRQASHMVAGAVLSRMGVRTTPTDGGEAEKA